MAIRNILKDGDPVLREKSRVIKKVTPHIVETLEDMVETMREMGGVGLAAPQIGVTRRMFVAEPEPDKLFYMINPEILEQSGKQEGEEGCLSVPDLQGTVVRPESITIKALDIDGNERTYELTDFYARVMCHEYDHLEGILYTDKATDLYNPEERLKELEEKGIDPGEDKKGAE